MLKYTREVSGHLRWLCPRNIEQGDDSGKIIKLQSRCGGVKVPVGSVMILKNDMRGLLIVSFPSCVLWYPMNSILGEQNPLRTAHIYSYIIHTIWPPIL